MTKIKSKVYELKLYKKTINNSIYNYCQKKATILGKLSNLGI